MDIIYSWVKNIVIYVILITVVMNLLGKSSYKKYIGIFTGMILVILVVSPLIKILNIENVLDYYFESNKFTIEANDISGKMTDMEENQNQIIIKEYKQTIAAQVNKILIRKELLAQSIEIQIVEDKESATFGAVESITVVASHGKAITEDEKINKISIDEIDLDTDQKNLLEDNDIKNKVSSLEETELKNTLADFYNVPIDNINISIQE